MRLYDIPAHLPFLDCLAAGMLAEMERDGPDALARATVLLPTRRSARALRVAFLKAANGRSLLMPRMRALAGLSTEDADELALPSLLDLPPAVEPLRRQAVLTDLVLRLPRAQGGPVTPEQAWSLASELGSLLDEIALEERDLDLLARSSPDELAEHWLERMEGLVPEEHAQHWQITLIFLRGVIAEWHSWLEREGLLDIGMRRVQALRAQTAEWRANPPADPVIAAGIGVGGTIPAAAELLRVIATALPRGLVVLHGTDQSTADDLWDTMCDAPTHPFCGQGRLLRLMGAVRGDVRRWPVCCEGAAIPAGRADLLGMALRPADGLSAWQKRDAARWEDATQGLSLQVAADAQHEAAAISLLLRETLEDPEARVALVTPDRDLARRVSAELIRHGISADDSAGEPLAETPAGTFLRLIARMVADNFAPVPLLAVLKHPFCSGGWDRGRWARAARLLEREVLRGPRPAPGLSGLRRAAVAAFASRRTAEPEVEAEVLALLDQVEACLGRFTALPDSPSLPPSSLLTHHLTAAEALAASAEEEGGLRLYAGEEGEPLATHLAELEMALDEMAPLSPASWPALLDASLVGKVSRSQRASRGRGHEPHPRVEILGLLEARLLNFDRVVLGALDETVWPMATDAGPWMSRPMRREFGLPEAEARIGRVCADFLLTVCSAPDAILSRAAKRGGSPTVPARWLTRIETFLGGQRDDLHPTGVRLPVTLATAWAMALDRPDSVVSCERPAPRPPVEARPREISVTEVATLIADPYAFYARRVLGLRRLDPLDAEAGAADYGNLVHGAMHRFIRRVADNRAGWPGRQVAASWFEEAADQALDEAGARPGLIAFWRPRLSRIGEFVLSMEEPERLAGRIAASLTEVDARIEVRDESGRSITIKARADRIDRRPDGSYAIFDYKTGTVPEIAHLQDGAAPQLPLEAEILSRGGFRGCAKGSVSDLAYWKLTGGTTPGEALALGEKLRKRLGTPDAAGAIANLGEEALNSTHRLATRFLLGEAAFASRPHPGRDTPGRD